MKKNIIKFAIASIAVLSLAACAKTTTTKKATTANTTTVNKTTTGSKTTTNKVTTNKVTTNNKTTAGSIDSYKVTEAEFTDALSMKDVDAVATKRTFYMPVLNIGDVTLTVINNSYYGNFYVEDEKLTVSTFEKYVEKDGKQYVYSYTPFEYNDGLFLNSVDEDGYVTTIQDFFGFLTDFVSLYNEFTFDEETKSYKAETVSFESEGHPITLKNVEMSFLDGKLTVFKYGMEVANYTFEIEYEATDEDILDLVDGLYDNTALENETKGIEVEDYFDYNYLSVSGKYFGENVGTSFKISSWKDGYIPTLTKNTEDDEDLIGRISKYLNAFMLLDMENLTVVSEKDGNIIDVYLEEDYSEYGLYEYYYMLELDTSTATTTNDNPLCTRSITVYNAKTNEKVADLDLTFVSVVE